MMEKKEILESGLLEQYLLGELTGSQQEQVAHFVRTDEEVRMAYSKLEADLERMAQENAIAPPPMVKAQLIEELRSEDTATVSMPSRSRSNPWLAVAASIALLLGISSYWLYSKWNSAEENLKLVEQQRTELDQELTELVASYDEVLEWYKAINDPNAIKVVLKGNDLAPKALAVGYVNHETRSVVMDAKGLPALDEDHDYQLWADVDGEMIDMGVIKKGTEMLAMNYIENAESLNITIEPAGGNDHPTVERLISNVYL
ncbi:MAG: anti-sigma factor [Bacteroidota bacterium]